MTEEVSLEPVYQRGFDTEEYAKSVDRRNAIFQEIKDLADASSPIYVRVVEGDYMGSIAMYDLDYINISQSAAHNRGHTSAMGRLRWTGRGNKPKQALGGKNLIYLRDYGGPTVFKKFDAAARKAELLENPDQRDIDGNQLEVGDEVLYINSRYGSGSYLSHGRIDRFEAKASTTEESVFTIVVGRGADGSVQESKLSDPSKTVYKKYPSVVEL